MCALDRLISDFVSDFTAPRRGPPQEGNSPFSGCGIGRGNPMHFWWTFRPVEPRDGFLSVVPRNRSDCDLDLMKTGVSENNPIPTPHSSDFSCCARLAIFTIRSSCTYLYFSSTMSAIVSKKKGLLFEAISAFENIPLCNFYLLTLNLNEWSFVSLDWSVKFFLSRFIICTYMYLLNTAMFHWEKYYNVKVTILHSSVNFL